MSERDFEQNPYSADEQRVCDYLQKLTDQIGCGDDPIGFLIASHQLLSMEQKAWKKCPYNGHECDWPECECTHEG
jgi:hypothetical protein